MRYEHDPHYGLPLPDDFRTFYPYTPNEVKHRRRTTSAQLKVLESIFRVDTKPNATLRNDLAAQLGMTARGVQVWFQNRRAKEKNKANKKQNSASAAAAGAVSSTDPAAATSTDASLKEDDEADQASPPPATPGEELLEELLKAEPPHDVPSNQHVDSQTSSPSPALASPPKLHLLTDPAPSSSSAASWKPTLSDETPPDSAVFPSRQSLVDILSQRRPSLPANAIFGPFTTTTSTYGPRSIDAWDPHARRRSVDTSLQRLVMHPYAQHARARNGALFGPRSPSQPQSGRQSCLPGKKSLPLQARRPFLPHHPPPNHYLDMRRASMDPRTLMPSRTDGLSPSLSPRPLHAVRASLPDTSVFTSSRRYVSQIPGPLPEPNFTFGAPSLSSPTDDEPSSPDLSSYSFPPKDDSTEDDDVMSSLSFDTLSRFGSAVSIATSESSVFSSPAFYDIGELAPNQDRRSSCGSAQLPCMTASLDGAMPPLQQSPAPVTNDGYFNESPTCTGILPPGANHDPQSQPNDPSPTSSFTSPASTASPDSGGSTTHSSTPPANGSVATNSELVSVFVKEAQKLGLSNDGSSALSNLDPSEQLQQQHSGSSSSLTQTPPPNQQLVASGHQAQAVENDPSFTFDGSPETRIDVASVALDGRPSVAVPVLLGQDATGVRPTDEQLSKNSALLSNGLPHGQGGFGTPYSNLMDGFDFDTTLAMFDNGPGQAEQRSADTSCDPLAGLGLGAGVDEYATSGVVASGAYGSVTGIAPNHPTYVS